MSTSIATSWGTPHGAHRLLLAGVPSWCASIATSRGTPHGAHRLLLAGVHLMVRIDCY